MGHPVAKAAGLAAGTILIAIGLSAQFGGSDIFKPSSRPATAAKAPSARAHPSPSPSPSAQPSAPAPAQDESVSVAGTIFTPVEGGGGGKKKHGKG